jgi:lysophospholipase L1-like esterase
MPVFTNKTKRYALIFITLFIVSELVLRYCFGFCNAILYVASPDYEYIVAPNQDGQRFGHHFHINSFSQRSEEPMPAKTKILALGDSVIYGGVQTGQDSLATSLFTARTGVQMLNISAGSWGPDNCAAYLKEKGLFGAEAIILEVSGHDAYDTMNFLPVVGVLPSYPDKQSLLAWGELVNRYVIPFIFKSISRKESAVTQPIRKKSSVFNPGLKQLKDIANTANLPFIIYLHPVQWEVRTKKNLDISKEIIEWCALNKVTLVNGLNYNFTKDDYRDIIHLNAKGQNKLAGALQQYLEENQIVLQTTKK